MSMARHVLFISQFLLVVGLLTVHFFALQNDLYWRYLWLDIPMHFFGGLWAALAVVWLFAWLSRQGTFARVMLAVLAIGIAWEIFEVLIGMTNATNYTLDTSLDILMDILGGITGYALAKRVIQSDSNAEGKDHSS